MSIATIKAIFHATENWFLLALASLGCIVFGARHDYSNRYWILTVGCWLVLDIYWVLAAPPTKPVITPRQRWATLLVYGLYCLPLGSVPLLGQRVLPRFVALQALGTLMCMLGVGFAIWARSVLGESWNATTVRPEGHCLVQRGPYAIVRHPIYFGFLVAVIGMALALGEARAFALFFGVVILLKKMRQEESILRAAFQREYSEYEQRVKRLLPWIW